MEEISLLNNKKTIAISIPTGIGLDMGGYAGDFGYIAREFSKYFNVIVNPNAVNGGILSAINENMLYVEGYALDEFLCGNINLEPVSNPNKIGVILDCAIPQNILNLHINTLNALKIVCGIDILSPVLTKEAVGVEFSINKETKISTGSISNPKTLLNAGKELIKQGATALAVVCFFKDYDEADDLNYTNATGVDPIGGIEAVISHYLIKEFKLPSAHSPAFASLDISAKIENPKTSSELISSTYLPCIIKGLEFAPKFVKKGGINYQDIVGFVVPSDSMGSKGVLGALKNNVPIFRVKNKSQLNIGCTELQIDDIFEFENYFELLKNLKCKLL